MKSIKELFIELKQKELSFATKQWIFIIVSVVIGICLSDDLYRDNHDWRWIDSGWIIIRGHHIDGMFRGLSFALVVVGMNIIYRFFKKRKYVYREHKTWTLRQIMLESLKYIGIIGLIFITLILWVALSFTMQPLSMFITIYLVYTIIHALLKHEKWWHCAVVILVFAVVGAWYVFNNDIEGPTLWRISDDIVDTPGQWLDCYRFYWCGRVIHDTSLLGGLISFIILILMKLVREIYTQCKKRKSPKINEPKPRLDNSLERFVSAQERMYPRALEEVKNGRKLSHWIWYIFPQLKGLGTSNNSRYYGLDGIEEARAYLAHPVLGARLREITTVVLESNKDVDEIFGGIDTIKLRSCMTLFAEIADDDLFAKVLEKHFNNKADRQTTTMINPPVKIDCLLGAIAGDVIGSVYEFRTFKGTSFPLFSEYSEFTDDTVMTMANADWLLSGDSLLGIMQEYGHRYPTAGYGGMFKDWLWSDDPQPYGSWGNGSAMRVSPVGWAFTTLEETLEAAKQSAEITHNHPEGIKGAQATAACIYLARTGKSKEYIKEYVEATFGYNLSRTCDEIRPVYQFDGSCQGTVPESIIAFLESTDYESAIRLTISLGGDADTMGAITGAIAEAYYGGVPEHIKQEVLKRLPDEFIDVMSEFYKRFVDAKKCCENICEGSTNCNEFNGIWDAKRIIKNYIHFYEYEFNHSTKEMRPDESIKYDRFCSALSAYTTTWDEVDKEFHHISKSCSESKLAELSQLLKEHGQYEWLCDFAYREKLFEQLIRFRNRFILIENFWYGQQMGYSRTINITKKIYEKDINKHHDKLLKILILLLGDDFDQTFTEQELIDKYDYPVVTDKELRDMVFDISDF